MLELHGLPGASRPCVRLCLCGRVFVHEDASSACGVWLCCLSVARHGDSVWHEEGRRQDEEVRAHVERDAVRNNAHHLLHPGELPGRPSGLSHVHGCHCVVTVVSVVVADADVESSPSSLALSLCQTKTGITVPEVLVPFMGGTTFIPFTREPPVNTNKAKMERAAARKDAEASGAATPSTATAGALGRRVAATACPWAHSRGCLRVCVCGF